MAEARSSSLSELARFGFIDLSQTVAKLDQLVGLVGDSGRAALASLGRAANPDQALNYLLALAEIDKAKIKKLLGKEESAVRLCRLLGASEAMGDLLRRKPELFSFLEKPIDRPKSAVELRDSLVSSCTSVLVRDFEVQTAWSALRFAYRRELLQIAIFDLSQTDQELGLPTVAAALADLAGAALEGAIEIARFELKHSSEHGSFTAEEVDATRFAVIAMGKCGARELNYISDVDVIFVGESAGGDVDNSRAIEIATKLATRMMRAIDGTAQEPMLWQVDPNLRPEGKSGALVRTLESHVAYYDRWAQSWEFQALLKARPIAGDMTLGQAYVNALAPKVWASAARDGFVDSAQKMRERVTENISASEIDSQIKLGPGGLRDIEFTVQLLQLVHGRTDETLRHRDTLNAISALSNGGYIGRAEADSFSRHYRFLRLLEHRIQLSQMRRTHLMPSSETARRSLARSVDLKSNAENLIERWESVKLEVRGLHQRIFYRPLLSAVAKLEDSTLELSSSQAQDRLAAIGFADPRGALAQIAALTSGLSRRAAIQRQLLPVLLQWFSQGTDPDAALLAFRRLSEDLGESHWYLRMLRDSTGAAERMTQVLSNSRLATSLFERIPEAAAWFENPADLQPLSSDAIEAEFDAIIERHEDPEAAVASIKQTRRRETLRLALGAVLGDLNIEQVSRALSEICELYLKTMLDVALEYEALETSREEIENVLDFGIVAMGRFGGGELGFGSDADVMYVYQSRPGADADKAQKLAEQLVAQLKKLTADPLLEFEIDIDLRPEGKNGAVARSIDSYEAYYQRWADTWEAQALLRARVIAGSQQLDDDFTAIIDKYRYPAELKANAIVEIRRIKARVESERLPQGADPKRHLKLGRGSLSDVEWLVQLYQMKFGAEHPSIRNPKTLDSLNAMVEAKLIEAHDARVLTEAWTLASRVRSASVLWANKRTDVLPTDRRQLEGLARILEYPAGGATQLEEDYLAHTRRSRMVFERLFFA
ncbi:MAG: bifunctional [glutamine synthetase] adenylyltransferase/[glutamine synthetase]-adenylyl-L-tyrosine phosphorylase [Rhodoluna sp.]|nr:bifunctional [glutamine synthetase] adenylyltransferase/[glutamine synthetase]-adenylyl-L-tyrosine phosphorylase [Rhodoluna sp.]MBP6186892.1 bifunctional [glutamine synthetase] adenylyltransferase/[glutamine synthetase]-adenylyl-L-tyrosine phosphorylase [Rhodoluna sp.]